jgi:hypothetical protein
LTPKLSPVCKRDRPSLNGNVPLSPDYPTQEDSACLKRHRSPSKEAFEIKDHEPTDNSIGVNQSLEPAQVNGHSGASLARSNSNSTAVELNGRPRRSPQLSSRLVHDIPQSSVRRSEEPEEHTSASFAPETSQDSQSSAQPQVPQSSQAPVPLPAAASQGGMRPPRQPPVILPKVTTPQSALQPDQRSSSQPSSSAPTSTSQSFSTPHAQASSQPPLSRYTSLTSQTSQTSQQQPDRSPSASTHWTPLALSTHSAGSQPSIPHSITPTGSKKRPAELSPGITFAPFNQTAPNGSESCTAPSTKRQKTTDVQFRLSQSSAPLDWNALLVRIIPN